MKSLTFKFIIAFLVVAMVGSVISAVLINLGANQAFDNLIKNQEKEEFTAQILEYYEENQTLDGVWRGIMSERRQGMGNSPGTPFSSMQQAFVLVDSKGEVVVPSVNYKVGDNTNFKRISEEHYIYFNGEVIGGLIETGAKGIRDPNQQMYFKNVQKVIWLAAVAAGLIALVLGIVFSRRLVKPIRELTIASDQVAQGQHDVKVPVRSEDEIGVLAESFNRMNTELSRSNRVRKQMTADIAHDLRSPLTVINGYVEALRDGDLPATPARFEVVLKEVNQLQHLVEDLRLLSLADAGELSLNFQDISPVDLLRETADIFEQQASAKGIDLLVETEPQLSLIRVDSERIFQVMDNLIINAIRYTPEGGRITLAAREEEGEITLFVRDTGKGIPQNDAAQIFDRFYRANRSRSTENGQTGLGLAISKSIIELHGGRISVYSKLNEGTEFRIDLPALDKETNDLNGQVTR